MSRPTAIIAEDETPLRDELRALLSDLWPTLAIVAECADGRQAIDAMQSHQPDVAFLDIRMPLANGLEVARYAKNRTHIVFITAYDTFAVQAFEDGAVDYLLKPVDRERLRLAIDRIAAKLATRHPIDSTQLLDQLEARMLARPERMKWITATVGGAVRLISIDDVIYFRSDEKYTRVVTADGEAYIRVTIRDLLPRLDPDMFWQIHRGTIVRVAAIRSVQRDDDGKLQVTFTGKPELLAVSPSFAARFKGL